VEQGPCARVRELDPEVWVHRDHPLLQLLEQAEKAIPLTLDALERRPQALPHVVDGSREHSQLVPEARGQLAIEASLLDLRGRVRDPPQPAGDERRDAQADRRADGNGPESGGDDLVANDADCLYEVWAGRYSHEGGARAAAEGQRNCYDAAAVARLDDAPAVQRIVAQPREVRKRLERDPAGLCRGDEAPVVIEDEEGHATRVPELAGP
jgi:hypothetical protein